jgi:hypothetical protein
MRPREQAPEAPLRSAWRVVLDSLRPRREPYY